PLGFLVSARHALQHGHGATLQAVLSTGAGFIAPHFSAATQAFVDAAHGAGLPVSVWTVDDPATMEQLAAHGVDAITTNRPNVALPLT
ncbi:MAG: glycerophosphodiester phosphodiesterase, partial [Chloroflexota bacterium]